jgi:hypothetical protein
MPGQSSTLNPTHGSGWFVQVQPNEAAGHGRRTLRLNDRKVGSEPSTHCRGCDFIVCDALSWVGLKSLGSQSRRLDLNHPPTAVGGITGAQPRAAARRDLNLSNPLLGAEFLFLLPQLVSVSINS